MEAPTTQQGLPGSLPEIREVSYGNVRFQTNFVFLLCQLNKVIAVIKKSDLRQFMGLSKIVGLLNVVIAHQVG